MTREEIIEKVRKRMDEWTPFDSTPMLLGANEAMQPVSYQIEEVLDTCTEFVLRNAPLRCLKATNVWPLPNVTVIDRVGYVSLPNDFLRMNRVMFNDWLNPVQQFHEYGSKVADMQRFPWIRGNRRKPVCLLNENGGSKTLECYSTGGGITELVYIASSRFDSVDRDFMTDEAIDMLLEHTASALELRTKS
jgi:hypothetical protein